MVHSAKSEATRTRVIIRAVSSVAEAPSKYELPSWARFEMGAAPVFWETSAGGPPSSGELLTVWINPESTELEPNADFGIAFNGGFNTPIMCGGEPRQMTKKERGPNCSPFFSININVPLHARTLIFSVTDGVRWNGPYSVTFALPASFRGKSDAFFNEGLAKELAADGACESAIYPDNAYVPDRCILPGGLTKEDGASCQLDIVPGCMNIESPFYDPLATVDDGSCQIDTDQPK